MAKVYDRMEWDFLANGYRGLWFTQGMTLYCKSYRGQWFPQGVYSNDNGLYILSFFF